MNARWVVLLAAISTPVFMRCLVAEGGALGIILAILLVPVAFCVWLACAAIWFCGGQK